MIGFALFGVIATVLLLLSYQDWKEKLIDTPPILWVMGFITAFYLIADRFPELLFWTLFILLSWKLAKPYFEDKKIIGAGDISVITTILPAAWFISPYCISIFLILIGLIAILVYKDKLKEKIELPMIPIITLAWILTWIISQAINLIK